MFENLILILAGIIFLLLYHFETKDQLFKLIWLGLGLVFIAGSLFINEDLSVLNQTTTYQAYNVITTNVPLNCQNIGILVGAGVTQCGTTTEVQQFPSRIVTSLTNQTFNSDTSISYIGNSYGIFIAGFIGLLAFRAFRQLKWFRR